MEGCNFSDKTTKILANFVTTWPGRKVGPRNLGTIANETGSAPPLVWIFNSAHEFPALAAALGPDQPLIALRSLNAACRIDKLMTWDERLVAKVYAQEIAPFLGTGSFFIGGNCQGATIASELARVLLLSGCDIRGFLAMEWVDLPPLPLEATLMFGAESELHNPFLRALDPVPIWRRIYAQHHVRILPGQHGFYFSPENIPALAGHIKTALATHRDPKRSRRAALSSVGLPDVVQAVQILSVDLPAKVRVNLNEDVLVLWDSHFSCLPHREIAQVVRLETGRIQLRFAAPLTVGTWTLQFFRCRPDVGPTSWAGDTKNYYQVEIIDGIRNA